MTVKSYCKHLVEDLGQEAPMALTVVVAEVAVLEP
jgi:hypothetical protein